jgi:hypothetical protein
LVYAVPTPNVLLEGFAGLVGLAVWAALAAGTIMVFGRQRT